MGYRIYYGPKKRFGWHWVLLVLPALILGTMLLANGAWYDDFARYVGASIRGH